MENTEKKHPKNIWELLKILKETNVPANEYQFKINKFLEFKAREHGIPYSGIFELTPLCNLDCKMCYVHLNKEQLNGANLLSIEQWKSLMLQAKNAGMRLATLSGGECLTYPGFDELYQYLNGLGVYVSVYTNGLLLDENRINFFKQNPPYCIQISLYGSSNEGYENVTGKRAFDVVLKNLQNAVNAELPIRVAVTPNRFMDKETENIIRFLKSSDIKYVINNTIYNPRESTGRDHIDYDIPLERYIEIYKLDRELSGLETLPLCEEELPTIGNYKTEVTHKGLQCGAGRSGFSISWDGKMHPCNQFQRIEEEPLLEKFSESWRKLNEWANNYPRIKECSGCAYSNVCGNCAAKLEEYAAPGELCLEWCNRTRSLVKNGINRIERCE